MQNSPPRKSWVRRSGVWGDPHVRANLALADFLCNPPEGREYAEGKDEGQDHHYSSYSPRGKVAEAKLAANQIQK